MKIELPAALGSAREFRCRCTLCRHRHKVHRHRRNFWPPSLPGRLHPTRWRTTHGNRRVWRRKLFSGSEDGQQRSQAFICPATGPLPTTRDSRSLQTLLGWSRRQSRPLRSVAERHEGLVLGVMLAPTSSTRTRRRAPRRIGQILGSSGHECVRWSERGFDNSHRPVHAMSRSIITWSEIASEI